METHTNLKINTRPARPSRVAARRASAMPEAAKNTKKPAKGSQHRIHVLDIVIIILIVADLTLSGIFAYYFYNNILL